MIQVFTYMNKSMNILNLRIDEVSLIYSFKQLGFIIKYSSFLLIHKMSIQVNKQATIVFEPLSIDSKFEKQLGVQIAFYRSNLSFIKHSDDKVKKTQPIKLTQPQKTYNFNPKQSAMKLHTILTYNQQEDQIQNKTFKVQVVFKIDGHKNSIEKQIQVSQHYKKSKSINSLKLTQKPQTQLKYRIHVFLKDEKQKQKNRLPPVETQLKGKQSKKEIQISGQNQKSVTPAKQTHPIKISPKSILTNKSLKIIKLQENKMEGNQNGPVKIQRGKRTNTVRILQTFKSHKQLQRPQRFQREQNEEKVAQNVTIKKLQFKLLAVEKELKVKQKESQKLRSKYSELQTKYKELSNKFQKVNDKCTELTLQKEKWQSKQLNTSIESSESDLKKQRQKYEKLQKQHKKMKQQLSEMTKKLQAKQIQLKKSMSENKVLQQKSKRNQNKLKELDQRNSELQKLLIQIEGKNLKSSGNSLEESLKPYKERIKLLERQNQSLQQDKNYTEQQSQSLKDQIQELKHKIKSINEENLKLTENLSNTDYQTQKLTKKLKQLQTQLNEFKQKIDTSEMDSIQDQDQQKKDHQSDTHTYGKYKSFKSQKIIGGGLGTDSINKLKAQNSELKTKLTIAMKNLENKQNLLKKFDTFSKQGRKQLQDELQKLKNQNLELKQKSSAKQAGQKGDIGGLQMKMELEKVKRELQYKTKSERQLLVEKSQLQSRNKTLQQDVVKSKQSMANILNVIHQHGDENLIEEVNTFLG